jgi:hypothetical protein
MELGRRSARGTVRGDAAPSRVRSGWQPSLTVVPPPEPSRLPPLVAALVATTLVFLVVLVRKPGGEQVVVTVSDVATAAAAALAMVTCAGAARRQVAQASAFWWLLTASMAAWTFGELAWMWYEVVLGVTVPTPSWADLGYLTGPVLAVAAFASHPASRDRGRWRVVPVLDGVALAGALLFVSWTLVLGPLWARAGGPSMRAFVELGYPFSDVVIVVLVVLVLRDLPAGHRTVMFLLLGGLLCMAVSDSSYTYLTQIGTFTSGDLLDAGWFASYLAIAVAAVVSRRDGETPPIRERHPRLLLLAPYVPVLIALIVIPFKVSGGDGLDPAEWIIATCLAVVVLSRGLIDLVQRHIRRRIPDPRAATTGSDRPRVRSSRHLAMPGNVHLGGASSPRLRGQFDPAGELAHIALELVAASRPTAQAQVQRITGRSVVALTSVAAVLAAWDLLLLVRGVGRA